MRKTGIILIALHFCHVFLLVGISRLWQWLPFLVLVPFLFLYIQAHSPHLPGIPDPFTFPQNKLLARCLLTSSAELTWNEWHPHARGVSNMQQQQQQGCERWGREPDESKTQAINETQVWAHHLSASNGKRYRVKKATTIHSNSVQTGFIRRTGDSRGRSWGPGEQIFSQAPHY